MNHCGCCFIVPTKVLLRFARDRRLKASQRRAFAAAARLEKEWRHARQVKSRLARLAAEVLPADLGAAAAAPPHVLVFDCRHGTVLPGAPVHDPAASHDEAPAHAFTETTEVVRFFRTVFGRNSLDGNGMALLSSVHYSVQYNNAFWNGSQMTYGDGDGAIFRDFTSATDVIAHELTHGLTQFTAGLGYEDEAGGLNESISDVFGSMFRQWRKGQTVVQADWLIGSDIMGPVARARGYECLRDMADPAAEHCLSPQPAHFSRYRDGMDPHESSGIPNLAFCKAALALGGNSWSVAGRIWFQALTAQKPAPRMRMKTFANRTRAAATSLYPAEPAVRAAIDAAWKAVGL
ncbi:MAG TPA: M4 family metallopeptidase [Steroidobacteraceae bacterium]|nr:M4 family metallopeptidase [Steroidobacteraceae bacterium]